MITENAKYYQQVFIKISHSLSTIGIKGKQNMVGSVSYTHLIILGMNVKNKLMVIQELFINLLQMKKRQKHL